jgi:hypothetical protein
LTFGKHRDPTTIALHPFVLNNPKTFQHIIVPPLRCLRFNVAGQLF